MSQERKNCDLSLFYLGIFELLVCLFISGRFSPLSQLNLPTYKSCFKFYRRQADFMTYGHVDGSTLRWHYLNRLGVLAKQCSVWCNALSTAWIFQRGRCAFANQWVRACIATCLVIISFTYGGFPILETYPVSAPFAGNNCDLDGCHELLTVQVIC